MDTARNAHKPHTVNVQVVSVCFFFYCYFCFETCSGFYTGGKQAPHYSLFGWFNCTRWSDAARSTFVLIYCESRETASLNGTGARMLIGFMRVFYSVIANQTSYIRTQASVIDSLTLHWGVLARQCLLKWGFVYRMIYLDGSHTVKFVIVLTTVNSSRVCKLYLWI